MANVYAYEPDTLVVDVEAAAPRSPEAIMHVIVMGQRHRRTPDLTTTACGVPYHSQFTLTRPERLTCADGPLCPECFTHFEIDKAELADRKQGER